MIACKCGCGKLIEPIPGHRPRLYYNDACKVRSNRNKAIVTEAIVTQSCEVSSLGVEVSIDYADANIHMSDICRRTSGAITLPGDPGYSGVCRQVSGQWLAPSQREGTHA